MKRYKLVDQKYRTQVSEKNETCWQLPDGTHPRIVATGTGTDLCTAGVIHSYASPELAVLMNAAHAAIREPRLQWHTVEPTTDDDGDEIEEEKYAASDVDVVAPTGRTLTVARIIA